MMYFYFSKKDNSLLMRSRGRIKFDEIKMFVIEKEPTSEELAELRLNPKVIWRGEDWEFIEHPRLKMKREKLLKKDKLKEIKLKVGDKTLKPEDALVQLISLIDV